MGLARRIIAAGMRSIIHRETPEPISAELSPARLFVKVRAAMEFRPYRGIKSAKNTG